MQNTSLEHVTVKRSAKGMTNKVQIFKYLSIVFGVPNMWWSLQPQPHCILIYLHFITM